MQNLIDSILWQGNARDAREIHQVLALGVQAIVDLAENESPVTFPRDVIVLRYPIADGSGNPAWLLRSIIRSLCGLLENKIPTFIYCSAGMSRSPTLAAAAISRLRAMSLDLAITQFFNEPKFDISPALWNDVRDLIENW